MNEKVGSNVKTDWQQAIDERQTPNVVTTGEVLAIVRSMLKDGVSSEDIVAADRLVADLETTQPNRSSWFTSLRNKVTSYADEHAQNLASARVLQTAARTQRSTVDAMKATLGAPPATPTKEFFTARLPELEKRGLLHQTPEVGLPMSKAKNEADVKTWNKHGHGDTFTHELQAFAQAVNELYPASDPRRMQALAAGFEAFTSKTFVHVGNSVSGRAAGVGNIDYDKIGETTGVDTSDLFVVRDGDRFLIDCEGFAKLSRDFFTAASGEVHHVQGDLGSSRHAMTVAAFGNTSIGTSNNQTRVLSAYGTQALREEMAKVAFETTGRPYKTTVF